MPSQFDYNQGRRDGDFLEALMLRGMFAVRRQTLIEVFGENPWHKSFQVWQNVPFFLTLREAGKSFGFILEQLCVCLHDERWHKNTIGNSMLDWHEQTVKSIALLIHRNQLWKQEYQFLNKRFIQVMKGVLVEHVGYDAEDVLEQLFVIARCLSLEESDACLQLEKYLDKTGDGIIKKVIPLILSEEWSELQSIKSSDINVPM